MPELNAAFTDPEDFARVFPGGAPRRALVGLLRDAGVARLVRAYAQGIDTDEALKSALDTDFARLQVSFDEFNNRMFGKLRLALEPEPRTRNSKACR